MFFFSGLKRWKTSNFDFLVLVVQFEKPRSFASFLVWLIGLYTTANFLYLPIEAVQIDSSVTVYPSNDQLVHYQLLPSTLVKRFT